jgi:hypothetical protein
LTIRLTLGEALVVATAVRKATIKKEMAIIRKITSFIAVPRRGDQGWNNENRAGASSSHSSGFSVVALGPPEFFSVPVDRETSVRWGRSASISMT